MTRFVLSHGLSHLHEDEARTQMRERTEAFFAQALADSVDLKSKPRKTRKADAPHRFLCVFDEDPEEVVAKAPQASQGTLIEPAYARRPARSRLSDGAGTGSAADGPGEGETLNLQLIGDEAPVVDARLTVTFVAQDGAVATSTAKTDVSGCAGIAHEARFHPASLVIEPASGFWNAIVTPPFGDGAIHLSDLPRTGPLGWWHEMMGHISAEPGGAGVRVGIVDTGCGPHPYLDHVNVVGAYVDGIFDPKGGADISNHGTHVSGLIGARPAEGSEQYAGLAQAAEIHVIRAVGADDTASQADIAATVDHLVHVQGVDLINISLGSAEPSWIEHDAILDAVNHGALCICAAGNENGGPVSYPGGYRETAAISGLGLTAAITPGALSAHYAPTGVQAAWKYGAAGAFLASFSSIGTQVTAGAPGVGIISTVPQHGKSEAPYAAMSGTSMASPLACAALASVLGTDQRYLEMPRDRSRAAYASATLAYRAAPIGLARAFQGFGLARA